MYYKQPKIWVYTLCYNEMRILPYIVKYWQKYADKVVVYDNGSIDGSQEFLNQFDFIELRHFDTHNEFNDLFNKLIKNEAWKEARDRDVDFVQVSDLDEVIYSPLSIKDICSSFIANKIDIILTNWIEVIAETFPTKINEEEFHKSKGFYGNNCGYPDPDRRILGKAKFMLFNPNTILESNFNEGSHFSNFIMRYPNVNPKYYKIDDNDTQLYTLHFDKIGLDYLQYKYSKNCARLSNVNKENHWGIHYSFNDEQKKKEIDNLMQNKIDISNL